MLYDVSSNVGSVVMVLHHLRRRNLLDAFVSALLSRRTGIPAVVASNHRRRLPAFAQFLHLSRKSRARTQRCSIAAELFLFPKILNNSALGEAHVDNLTTEFEQ